MTPKLKSLVCASLLLSTPGCGILMPKQVELFQRKVKAVPEISQSEQETQRQAADRLSRELANIRLSVSLENVSTNVTVPLAGAGQIADGLSVSLGPPKRPYLWSDTDLAERLRRNRASLNDEVRDYAESIEKDVGKKIEGTGLFRVGYFTMIGGLLLLGALVWFGLRVYGIFNPVVGGVTSVVGRVSHAVVSKGFTQLTAGGERFKDMLAESHLDEKTADYVKSLFASAHAHAQDEDVKDLVKGITKYPTSTPLPPPPES